MQRRLLGRWRVHIVTTRWSGPGPRELAAPGLRLAVLKSARALLAAPNRRAANRRPSPLLPRAGDPGDQD